MRQRVVTAAIGIPVVLAGLLAPSSVPLGVLLILLVVPALVEATKLASSSFPAFMGACYVATFALFWWLAASYGFLPLAGHNPAELAPTADAVEAQRFATRLLLVAFAASVVLAALALATQTTVERSVNLAVREAAIGVWIVAPLFVLLMTHAAVGPKILLAVVPVWAGDVAAIFAGRQWGRRKLAPAISPGKTWEGAIAGLAASLAAAVALAPVLSVEWPIALGCGLAAGILGPAGDLLESRLKREAGVKDSGSLLPGHGGVLDRIDSILLAAPVSCLLLVFG